MHIVCPHWPIDTTSCVARRPISRCFSHSCAEVSFLMSLKEVHGGPGASGVANASHGRSSSSSSSTGPLCWHTCKAKATGAAINAFLFSSFGGHSLLSGLLDEGAALAPHVE